MKIKKLLSLLLCLLLVLSIIPAVGIAETEAEEQDVETRIAQLLDYSARLHNMEKRYAPKVDKAARWEDPYANARIIVKFAGELDYSGSVAHVNGYNDWHVIQYRTSEEAEKAAATYRKLPGVAYVCPDQIMTIAQTPHNNNFNSWGYGANHVDAFNYTEWLLEQYGDDVNALPEIIVAVLDTGVDSDHPYLDGRHAPGGYDFVDNDNDPEDEHYHGTHVSGTIVDGTLPNVKIMGIRILDAQGYGNTTDIVNGMEYANLHGAKVANLSLRGPRTDDSFAMYTEVINNGIDNGTVYCVASGNDGGSSEDWTPGCVQRAFTVAAHDSNHAMAYFSNVGPSVDITAPGVNIRSCVPGGGYNNLDGTSMATPHVSAACALVLSFDPDMDPDAVIETLKGAAVDYGLSGGGTGLLNVTDLLKYDNILNGEGSTIHFTSGGTYPWATTETDAYSTNSGVANSTSTLTSRATLGAYQRISFEYKVSAGSGDRFVFTADGTELLSSNGTSGWQTYEGLIPGSGAITLNWSYIKDGSGNGGDDCARIRNVVVEKTISSVINGDGCSYLFESGDPYPWVVDGDAAMSGNTGVNNSVSDATATIHAEAGESVLFSYKTSCGSGDKFQFLVNGQVMMEATSTTDWTLYEYLIENAGDYEITFRYVKDGSGSTGSDRAWVKGVSMIYSLSSALNVPGGHLVFSNNSTYPWVAEGNYAKSGNRNVSSSSSALTLSISMNAGDTLTFRYKVSSESNYDWFYFKVNGNQTFRYSGTVNWTTYTYTADTNGTYTFTWLYEKDYSVNTGDDCAYLDDVEFIASEPSFTPGDCDDDGDVDVTDSLLAMRFSMGIINASALNTEAADMNGNGTVEMSDAVTILRMAMGLI